MPRRDHSRAARGDHSGRARDHTDLRFFLHLPHNHSVSFHERHLPHWIPDGKPLFITWRLHGSLPRNRYVPAKSITSGEAFARMDRFLDAARYGPTWLRDRRVAEIVVNALQHHQQVLKHCELHAFVVMANHVHVLTTPLVPPSKLLHSLKGFTARKANRALRRTGERFWQEESYDHWIRDEGEFARVRRYIEGNPVRAGLVSSPEEFPWSSARVQPA